jgi:uncharacterized protein YoxC
LVSLLPTVSIPVPTVPVGSGLAPPTAAFAHLAAALQVVEPTGWRLWLVTAADVATVIIAIALLVTVLILLMIALQVWKLIKKAEPMLRQVQTHIDPLMGHARDVGENVNYMSSAIRADVQQVTELVDSTRRRLNQTADAAEVRIREFNALLGVMQEEAERLFIDTASTVRGVRAGSDTYRRRVTDGRELEIGIERED